MNSDHAPTAEEHLPWDMPSTDRADYEMVSDLAPEDRSRMDGLFKKYADLCFAAIQARDAALRENREKDARIAELEKNIAKRKAAGETTTRLFLSLQARAEAAEAKLRAVSDALQEKLELDECFIDNEEAAEFVAATKDLLVRIRAIVEGK